MRSIWTRHRIEWSPSDIHVGSNILNELVQFQAVLTKNDMKINDSLYWYSVLIILRQKVFSYCSGWNASWKPNIWQIFPNTRTF